MKKRNGFVSNSSSSSFTVSISSVDCSWCACVQEDCETPIIYDSLFFCSMDCLNKYLEIGKRLEAKESVVEEPVVEVARFELMDFE